MDAFAIPFKPTKYIEPNGKTTNMQEAKKSHPNPFNFLGLYMVLARNPKLSQCRNFTNKQLAGNISSSSFRLNQNVIVITNT